MHNECMTSVNIKCIQLRVFQGNAFSTGSEQTHIHSLGVFVCVCMHAFSNRQTFVLAHRHPKMHFYVGQHFPLNRAFAARCARCKTKICKRDAWTKRRQEGCSTPFDFTARARCNSSVLFHFPILFSSAFFFVFFIHIQTAITCWLCWCVWGLFMFYFVGWINRFATIFFVRSAALELEVFKWNREFSLNAKEIVAAIWGIISLPFGSFFPCSSSTVLIELILTLELMILHFCKRWQTLTWWSMIKIEVCSIDFYVIANWICFEFSLLPLDTNNVDVKVKVWWIALHCFHFQLHGLRFFDSFYFFTRTFRSPRIIKRKRRSVISNDSSFVQRNERSNKKTGVEKMHAKDRALVASDFDLFIHGNNFLFVQVAQRNACCPFEEVISIPKKITFWLLHFKFNFLLSSDCQNDSRWNDD